MAVDPDRINAFMAGFRMAPTPDTLDNYMAAGIEALDAYDYEQAVQSFNDADVISSGE